MDELTGEFVAETRETLDQISEALVGWEARPDDVERLDSIFRFVHTVKGSCGFLDLPRIAALAHAAETTLAELRAGKRLAEASVVGALLAIIDRIAVLVEALESNAIVPDTAGDASLIDALDGRAVSAPVEKPVAAVTRQRSVRISVDLLDMAMTQVSDLVLARNELARCLRAGGGDDVRMDSAFERVSAAIGDVRESIARTRMQPIEKLFATLPRLVRDTASVTGKSVELRIEGSDVEIDREMIEAIRDPLTHIVRNAIDHGIEHDVERRQQKKPGQGQLVVTACQSGNQVSITVADDGRGIDVARLIEKAVAGDVISRAKADSLSHEAATQLIFAPGLSTADTVTDISGRGVGMDVVRANVERLGGAIGIDNRPGIGLSITLRVPLTLSIMNALLVEAGGQGFAIPRASIDEIVSVKSASVRLEDVGGGQIAVVRGRMLSVVSLARVLDLTDERPSHLAIIELPGGSRYALGVTNMRDHEELVVRPSAPALAALGVFAGQTLPDNGVPVLVLDPVGIGERAGIDGSLRHDQRPEDVLGLAPKQGSMLTFEGLDGVVRGVRARLVDHIADAESSDFVGVGDASYLTVDGTLIPVVKDGTIPGDGRVAVLHLVTEGASVAYPVRGVQDLWPIGSVAPVSDDVAEGFVLVEGRPIELIAWPRAVKASPRRRRA